MTEPGPKKVLLLEFNEVPNTIIDRYCRARPGSVLASVAKASTRYRTELPHSGFLEPWTAWPGFHRGVDNSQHGVFALGQPLGEANRRFPPIWQHLANAGLKVGVFGSLHARLEAEPEPQRYRFFVPDFFAPDFDVVPQSLDIYQEFNLRMTRSSTHTVSRGIPLGLAGRFLTSALSLGVSAATIAELIRHLFAEVLDVKKKIRRRSMQSLLMTDVFTRMVDKTRPDFATFYVNHVATAMHRYWAAAFPDDYETLPLSPQYLENYRDEVFYSLDVFDLTLKKIVELSRKHDYLLTIASGFGQRAVPTQHTYSFVTISNVRRFMSALGFSPQAWSFAPAMTPNFGFTLADKQAAAYFHQQLQSMRIGAFAMLEHEDIAPPMCYREMSGGYFTLYFQIDDYHGEKTIDVAGKRLSFAQAGLASRAHGDAIGYAAYHTKEGSLMVYDAGRSAKRTDIQSVSALDYLPSVLAHFVVEQPDYLQMNRNLLGVS